MGRSTLVIAGVAGALAGVAIIASFVRCASQLSSTSSEQASRVVPKDGAALLVGADTAKVRVLIRRIDEGPVLWATPSTLGTRASILPGHHHVQVMCDFKNLVATPLVPSELSNNEVPLDVIRPGDLTLEASVGHVYDLLGTLSQDGDRCDVSISSRS